MMTFIMFGKYSIEGLKAVSEERTKKSVDLLEKLGGKVKAIYVLLGEIDLLVIVEFLGFKEAMRASVELAKLLGISLTTAPAVAAEEFDRLIK